MFIQRGIIAAVIIVFGLLLPGYGQTDTTEVVQTEQAIQNKIRFSAYGVVNYYAFDWETLPGKRNVLDPERLNLYMYYDFTDKIEFKSEIEIEHGGTGATMAFDPLEEFGEFEQEIETGGKVSLEQLNLLFKFKKALNLRVGKLKVHMGNASELDEPGDYLTAYRSEVENTLLPLGWYETGLELTGSLSLQPANDYPAISYNVYVVSGLDNSAFSSRNWIRRGYQTKFETINADNLAYAFRADYQFSKDSEIGFSGYAGNPTGNRPKRDFTAPSWVTVGDVHFHWDSDPWRINAYVMAGHIQNSAALSAANRNLSNNLNVKRTPVGKMAAGAYGELAYDLLHSRTAIEQKLYLFGRAEWYDSMWKVEGNISDNPRYERKVYTVGINFFPIHAIVVKAHYAWRTLGSGEHDNTFVLGIGFEI